MLQSFRTAGSSWEFTTDANTLFDERHRLHLQTFAKRNAGKYTGFPRED
jgi:hypothetical protein